MPTLLRHRSRRVDVFLDWLVSPIVSVRYLPNTKRAEENGAFTALRAGNLQALQVYVHVDPAHREKIVETYTFRVKYFPATGDNRKPSGLELDSSKSALVSVEATNKALGDLLRQVAQLCDSLPDLPGKSSAHHHARKSTVPSNTLNFRDALHFNGLVLC